MSTSSTGESSASRKRRRVTRACDRCHRLGIKCAATPEPQSCKRCSYERLQCTFNRPLKRRGPVPTVPEWERSASNPPARSSDGSWEYETVAELELVLVLVEAYHRIVYPIFPYFHWPSFVADVNDERHKRDRAFCAVVMAMCAIVISRVKDSKALSSWSELLPSFPATTPPSAAFYHAAVRAIPQEIAEAAGDFNFKRGKALLAVLSVQYGRTTQLQAHLGDYITLLRHRELESTVLYPAEVVDDGDIQLFGTAPSATDGRVSWLRGWNFTTDLYRVLEHALERLRAARQAHIGDPLRPFVAIASEPPAEELKNMVDTMYHNLPEIFKSVQPIGGHPAEDRFGFQAANIIVTLQTLKMVTTGFDHSSVEQRCAVAGELLDSLATVPTGYILAISAPMLHHLAGIGNLLAAVIQSPLSQWAYLQVRNVLLALANLLASLETALDVVAGVADRMRAQVARIDEYMTAAALDRSRSTKVFHSAVPIDAWSHPPQGSGGPADVPAAVNSSSNAQPSSVLDLQLFSSSNVMPPVDALIPQPHEDHLSVLENWQPPVDTSPNAQFVIPDELVDVLAQLAYDMGQGANFDFLSDGSLLPPFDQSQGDSTS